MICPKCGATLECERCLERDQEACYTQLRQVLDAHGELAELGLHELLELAGVATDRPRVYLHALLRLLEEGRVTVIWYQECPVVCRVVQPSDPS